MEDQFWQVLTGGRRSSILPTYTVPNELKLHIDVHKRLCYENILPNLLHTVLFGSRRAPKLAVLLQGWQFSAAFSMYMV